jgi:hypothetical protein
VLHDEARAALYALSNPALSASAQIIMRAFGSFLGQTSATASRLPQSKATTAIPPSVFVHRRHGRKAFADAEAGRVIVGLADHVVTAPFPPALEKSLSAVRRDELTIDECAGGVEHRHDQKAMVEA